MRIAEEAREQGGVLTQEDLGVLLHCDERTIRRDIKDLRAKGIQVPTRGFVQDIGPTLSHKAQAIRHWLEGKEPVAVARAINHSLAAVERYLEDFKRVSLLVMKGLDEIASARAANLSPALVKTYRSMYAEAKEKPGYAYRFKELAEMTGNAPATRTRAAKRGRHERSLFVHRRLPNEQASKEYLIGTYGPQAQKTFTGALEAFFVTEFPQLAGDRARRSVVQGIVEMVHRFFPATSNLRQEARRPGSAWPRMRWPPTARPFPRRGWFRSLSAS